MILALLYLISILGILLLAFATLRVFQFSAEIRYLRDVPLQDREAWPMISVVIPACNESETIDDAIVRLRKIDYPNLQLVFVNDRSSDETGSIIAKHCKEDSRIEQIDNKELPSGWLGKPHALKCGSDRAKGEFILFTDADVLFSPTTLKRTVLYVEENELDFVAGIPQFIAKDFLLKAAFAYFSQQIALPIQPQKVRDKKSPTFIGLGGFNFVRRTAWEKTSKFDDIKTEVVEDMGIGLTLKRSGAHCDVINLSGEAELEWYPNLWSFIKGLEKNSFSSAEYSIGKLMVVTFLPLAVFFGAFLLPFTVTRPLMPIALATIVAWFSMNARLLAPQHLWGSHILFVPLYFLLFPLITLRASILCLMRGGVYWRGTFYSIATLRDGQRVKMLELLRPKRS